MKNYLSYDETLAKKLQRKHGLSGATLRVWKHRNGIPTRYATPGYTAAERANKATLKKVEAFLALPWVNRSGFEGIAAHRLNDFMREEKRKTLSCVDADIVLFSAKLLKTILRRLLRDRQLKDLSDLLGLSFLRPMLFIGNLQDYSRLRGKAKSMSDADWDWLSEKLQQHLSSL